MEPSNQTLHEILIRIEDKINSINGRVRKLEVWKGVITGGLLVLGGTIIPIIIKIFI